MPVETTTPNFGWVKPAVGGDSGIWGNVLNDTLDQIDGDLAATKGVVLDDNEINLNSVSPGTDNVNHIRGLINGLKRWNVLLGDGTAETGSNTGSDFAIQACDDSGNFLSRPVSINRATGNFNIHNGLNVDTLATIGDANVVRTLTVHGTATFAGLVASSMNCPAFYGNVGFTGNVGVSGTFAVGGAATFNSTLSASGFAGAQYFVVNGTNTALLQNTVQFRTSWNIFCNGSAIFFNGASGELAEMDNGGNFGITSQGYKPGGGSWASSTSDARVKTVERPYELGLDEVLKLAPVRYRFKGNDAEPDKASKTAMVRDKVFVGLVAQEAEKVFPGMVTKRRGYVDGREVNDLRELDSSELIYALVNAVKTLTKRVEELEAK